MGTHGEEMKTCSFCQMDNADDAKYCRECGKTLAQPPVDLSEREILLQVRDLLDKRVKQSEDYQREALQIMEQSEQRTDKQRREWRRGVVALLCLFIVIIIVLIITASHWSWMRSITRSSFFILVFFLTIQNLFWKINHTALINTKTEGSLMHLDVCLVIGVHSIVTLGYLAQAWVHPHYLSVHCQANAFNIVFHMT